MAAPASTALRRCWRRPKCRRRRPAWRRRNLRRVRLGRARCGEPRSRDVRVSAGRLVAAMQWMEHCTWWHSMQRMAHRRRAAERRCMARRRRAVPGPAIGTTPASRPGLSVAAMQWMEHCTWWHSMQRMAHRRRASRAADWPRASAPLRRLVRRAVRRARRRRRGTRPTPPIEALLLAPLPTYQGHETRRPAWSQMRVRAPRHGAATRNSTRSANGAGEQRSHGVARSAPERERTRKTLLGARFGGLLTEPEPMPPNGATPVRVR